MLGTNLLLGFSETARSHPAHREAGRHGKDQLAISVFSRSVADDFGEGPAEGTQAVEANVHANVRDASLGLSEQEHRALDAPALQVAVRRFAKGRLEGPDEVGLRNVCDFRQVCDVEWQGVRAVHRTA